MTEQILTSYKLRTEALMSLCVQFIHLLFLVAPLDCLLSGVPWVFTLRVHCCSQ